MKLVDLYRTMWLLCALVLAAFAADEEKAFTFGKADLDLLEQSNLLDQRLEKLGLVWHDEAVNAYVGQVGRSMLPAGSAPERVKWEFRVLRDPMQNAFALPNGSVYIDTGLLSLLVNEDQLASVLAHEITHVADRHGYLHYRDYRKKSAIISSVEFAARMAPGGASWGNAIRLAGLIVPAILDSSINGYQKELERRADIYSFNKLIEGNYDPREMPNTFRLLQNKEEVDLTKIYYNDHPKLEERVTYLNELIASKSPKEIPADVLAARRMKYQGLTESVTREDIRLAILSYRPRTALARATKLVQLHPDSAENLFSMAEAYRALGPWTPGPSDEEFSKSGKKEANKLKSKLTPGEEEQELLGRDSGQAAWKENQKSAEDTYQKALAADPANAKTYRGLGQLYEMQHRTKEAIEAYQKYIDLAPKAIDNHQFMMRVESLQRGGSK